MLAEVKFPPKTVDIYIYTTKFERVDKCQSPFRKMDQGRSLGNSEGGVRKGYRKEQTGVLDLQKAVFYLIRAMPLISTFFWV